ncbi:MAG: hypothetical protein KDA17_05150 [Candidatus Saccharibacteria bacterium]|nr:hypothetical protein [Candidatus Saccharibacteria bacterium]
MSEKRILHHMAYCVHFKRIGFLKREIECKAGFGDETLLATLKAGGTLLDVPCIDGHKLPAKDRCPGWKRVTRKDAEAKVAKSEKSMERLIAALTVIAPWKAKPPQGKQEVIECPICKGRLHLSQAASNGHVHASCETDGCVRFME